ncbi:hypothetical protein [Siphonobacter sp.]|uniref:hypothetical protein n=1 Tax=Siphonobacter sp. TaxID=1869184 RepID=UPI003B3A0C2D
MIRKITFAFLASLLLACDNTQMEQVREDLKGWQMVEQLEKLNSKLTANNTVLTRNIAVYEEHIKLRDTMDQLKDERLAIYERHIASQNRAISAYQSQVNRLEDQVWVYQKWMNYHTPQRFNVDTTFTLSEY